jgi:hypothetical protein
MLTHDCAAKTKIEAGGCVGKRLTQENSHLGEPLHKTSVPEQDAGFKQAEQYKFKDFVYVVNKGAIILGPSSTTGHQDVCSQLPTLSFNRKITPSAWQNKS